LDPVKHIATQIRHPYRDPETPSSASLPKGVSAYWGNEPPWDSHTSIHNPMMDREGRVWFTSRIRPAAAQPAYCSDGSLPSSQGWTPIVVDSNGNGVRDDSDTRLRAAFYGVTPSTVDDSVWGQSMGIGFARMHQPGYLMRIVPGPNPAETALTEVYVPPEGAY